MFMTHRRNFIFTAIFVLILSVIIAPFVFGEGEESMYDASQEKEYPVKVITAHTDDLVPHINYGGFVKGKDQSIISPKINACLVEMKKNDGDRVKKGDVVAILNADELTQQVAGTQEMIGALDQTLHDTKKYYGQKIDEAKDDDASDESISSAKKLRTLQMQNVQNSITEAQAELRVAQSLAKETIVRAPFDGMIVRTFHEGGQIVGPETPLFEIANDVQKHVEIFVSEDIARNISVNDTVRIIAEKESRTISGSIMKIGKLSQSGAQQARVTIMVNDHEFVELGQFVTIQLSHKDIHDNALVVPERAVLQHYDNTFVYVVHDDGRAYKRAVTVGDAHDGSIEIITGITDGEIVVIDGMHMIKDRYLIKIYE